jgi:hypothetical protein
VSDGVRNARLVGATPANRVWLKPPLALRIVYWVEGRYMPLCASTFTVPPDKSALRPFVIVSVSLRLAALTLTLKTEPSRKLTSPLTVRLLNGTAAPGAIVAPAFAKTVPMTVPLPASVAPEFMLIGLVSPPSTASVPLLIVVPPMVELLFHTQVPLACTSRLWKS